MARYVVPTVYWQSTLNASSAVEIPYIKSLSWANKTNNNGSFELVTPMFGFNTFTPSVGSWIRLSPGDTVMQIEKLEKKCDEQGNFWYKMGGRPTQMDDETVRDAKNLGYYFRHVYNGINAQTYRTFIPGTPRTTINSRDLLQSSTYEDNLGGFTEIEEDTIHEAYSWGTIVTGQPRIVVNSVNRGMSFESRIPDNAMTAWNMYDNRAGMSIESSGFWTTHEPFITSSIPQISVGSASGANGRMDRITYNGSWMKNDTTNDIWVNGNQGYSWRIYRSSSNYTLWTWFGGGWGQQRTITLKTEQEYFAEMNALLVPCTPVSFPVQRRQSILQGIMSI